MGFALIPFLPSAGAPELLIVLVVVLLLFGAKRIPELARGLGSGVREFKEGTKEGPREDQIEDKKVGGEGEGENRSTTDAKTKNDAVLKDDASVEAEKAQQKRN